MKSIDSWLRLTRPCNAMQWLQMSTTKRMETIGSLQLGGLRRAWTEHSDLLTKCTDFEASVLEYNFCTNCLQYHTASYRPTSTGSELNCATLNWSSARAVLRFSNSFFFNLSRMHLSHLPKLFPLLRPVLHWSEGHRYFAAAISWYDTCHGCGILLSPGVGLQVFKGRVGPTLWLLCDHLRGQGIASNVWWRSFQMSFLGNPANLQRLASPCSCLGISLETKRYATRPVERKIKMYTGGCQKNAGAKPPTNLWIRINNPPSKMFVSFRRAKNGQR